MKKSGQKNQKSNKKFKKIQKEKKKHKIISVFEKSDYKRKLWKKKSKLLGGVVSWVQ